MCNFTRPFVPILIFSLTLAFGCNLQTTITKPILTDRERHLCDSLKIDTAIVIAIRTQTDSTLAPFPMNLETVLDKDIDANSKRKQFSGLTFDANNINADTIVINLYNDFQKKATQYLSLTEILQ